jgi:tetratricopeptide (TPR) repeat protein
MRYITLPIGVLALLGSVFVETGCGGESVDEQMQHDTTLSLVIREWSGRIVQYPKNDDYRYQRGMELAKGKIYTKALADFNKAIELNPKKADYYVAKADVHMALNETKNALKTYEAAIETDAQNENALLSLGRFQYFVRDFTKAQEVFAQLERVNPANAEGYFYQGMIYKELKDTAKAIDAFGKAVQIDLYYHNALIQLGQIYSDKNDKIGLSYYKNATLADEFSDEAFYGLGYLYQKLGQYDSAVANYQRTVNINALHYFAYYNTGYILFEDNKINRAIEHFQLAIKFAPGFAKAHYMLGLCSESKGDYDQAGVYFNRSLEKDPNFEDAKQGLIRLTTY